jgi:hypothetical protein
MAKPWIVTDLGPINGIEISNGEFLGILFDAANEDSRRKITVIKSLIDYEFCTLIVNGLFMIEGKDFDYFVDKEKNIVHTNFDIHQKDKVAIRLTTYKVGQLETINGILHIYDGVKFMKIERCDTCSCIELVRLNTLLPDVIKSFSYCPYCQRRL